MQQQKKRALLRRLFSNGSHGDLDGEDSRGDLLSSRSGASLNGSRPVGCSFHDITNSGPGADANLDANKHKINPIKSADFPSSNNHISKERGKAPLPNPSEVNFKSKYSGFLGKDGYVKGSESLKYKVWSSTFD